MCVRKVFCCCFLQTWWANMINLSDEICNWFIWGVLSSMYKYQFLLLTLPLMLLQVQHLNQINETIFLLHLKSCLKSLNWSWKLLLFHKAYQAYLQNFLESMYAIDVSEVCLLYNFMFFLLHIINWAIEQFLILNTATFPLCKSHLFT